VQGLSAQTDSPESGDSGSSFTFEDQQKMLFLLVPNESREILSLALQQGDHLVIFQAGKKSKSSSHMIWSAMQTVWKYSHHKKSVCVSAKTDTAESVKLRYETSVPFSTLSSICRSSPTFCHVGWFAPHGLVPARLR
jgi:hypothetical protein